MPMNFFQLNNFLINISFQTIFNGNNYIFHHFSVQSNISILNKLFILNAFPKFSINFNSTCAR